LRIFFKSLSNNTNDDRYTTPVGRSVSLRPAKSKALLCKMNVKSYQTTSLFGLPFVDFFNFNLKSLE